MRGTDILNLLLGVLRPWSAKILLAAGTKTVFEVKAFFIDEQGFTVRYADEVPTAPILKRLEEARREIAEGKGLSLEEVRQRLGL